MPAVTVVPVESLDALLPTTLGDGDGSSSLECGLDGPVLRLVAQVTAVDTLKLDTERWVAAAE